MSQVSRLAGFSIRSSGRDLTAVRRPVKVVAKKAKPVPSKDFSNNRSESFSKPERNDATVRPAERNDEPTDD